MRNLGSKKSFRETLAVCLMVSSVASFHAWAENLSHDELYQKVFRLSDRYYCISGTQQSGDCELTTSVQFFSGQDLSFRSRLYGNNPSLDIQRNKNRFRTQMEKMASDLADATEEMRRFRDDKREQEANSRLDRFLEPMRRQGWAAFPSDIAEKNLERLGDMQVSSLLAAELTHYPHCSPELALSPESYFKRQPPSTTIRTADIIQCYEEIRQRNRTGHRTEYSFIQGILKSQMGSICEDILTRSAPAACAGSDRKRRQLNSKYIAHMGEIMTSAAATAGIVGGTYLAGKAVGRTASAAACGSIGRIVNQTVHWSEDKLATLFKRGSKILVFDAAGVEAVEGVAGRGTLRRLLGQSAEALGKAVPIAGGVALTAAGWAIVLFTPSHGLGECSLCSNSGYIDLETQSAQYISKNLAPSCHHYEVDIKAEGCR